jgi:hypothetical protein
MNAGSGFIPPMLAWTGEPPTGPATLDRETELVLDNDGAFIYVGDQQAFDSHPHTVLREALTLLNIPWTEA